MGIAACDLHRGWMDYEEHESNLRGVLKAQTRRGVVLADIDKFGRQAYLNTFPINEKLTVVCDRRPPDSFLEIFTQHDIDLIHP
jgi:DeoR family transcriptional regulator, glycerol-3-phosphate regulon repressor